MSQQTRFWLKVVIGVAAFGGWAFPIFFMKALTSEQTYFTQWCFGIVAIMVGHFTGISFPDKPASKEPPVVNQPNVSNPTAPV